MLEVEKKYLYGAWGVIYDENMKVVAPTTRAAGIEIGNGKLADWIWQGIKYIADKINSNAFEGRKLYLKSELKGMLILHYRLLGASVNKSEEMADDFIKNIENFKREEI